MKKDRPNDGVGEKIKVSCSDPCHNPPVMLHVPPGVTYTHTCPACGYSITIKKPEASIMR